MLNRIPEPDLMDSIEQARAYSETDFSEPHDAFVSYFMERFPDFSGAELLDLGCGTADVIIRFARKFPEVRITGIDGAEAMLKIGRDEVALQELEDRIELRKCRLPDDALEKLEFDGIISNSLLHHLEDSSVLWNSVIRCGKAGCPVFVMDLMRPDSIERAKELVDIYASDAPEILKEDFYNSLLAAYSPDEIIEQLKNGGLGHLSVDVVSDRHLLIWGTLNE